MARDILSQAIYRVRGAVAVKPPPEPWWQQAWEWILDRLGDLLRNIFGPVSHAVVATSGFARIFGYVLIAVMLALVAFVIVRLVLSLAPRFPKGGALGAARSLDELHSHADWLALAKAAATRGDYRAAIAALFSAALALLDDRALVPFDAARTPGEYRRLVRRARSDASPPFDALTDRFIRATYAEAAPERADFDAASTALAALEPQVHA